MGEHYRGTDLAQQHGERVRLDLLILRRVEFGSLDPGKFIQSVCIVRGKLHARVRVRRCHSRKPEPQSPAVEATLVTEAGSVRGCPASLTCLTGPRQVGDVGREAAADEDVPEAFPAVERGFPRL